VLMKVAAVLVHWTTLLVYAVALTAGAVALVGGAQDQHRAAELVAAGTFCEDGDAGGDCLREEYGVAHGRWERPDARNVEWTLNGHHFSLGPDESEVVERSPGTLRALVYGDSLVALRTTDDEVLPVAGLGGARVAFRVATAAVVLALAAAFAVTGLGLAMRRPDAQRTMRAFLMAFAVVPGGIVAVGLSALGWGPGWLAPAAGGLVTLVAWWRAWLAGTIRPVSGAHAPST
jgi:hypothetical protein